MNLHRLSPLSLMVLAATALAQQRVPPTNIVVDGSTLGTQPFALQGPSYQIPQQLGRLSGSNLFHSFQSFRLAAGETANFSTSTAGISNVISRVTGGQSSLIEGAIRLTAASGTPAFFFINPAGVVFGNGASVDVPGAFHASTAPRLRLGDGSSFDTGTRDSSFGSAPPEAFGFLGAGRAAAVQMQGTAQLQGANGQAVSLSGGDLVLTASRLTASGGLTLVAAGTAAADVPLQGALPEGVDGTVGIGGGMVVGVVTPGAQDAGNLQLRAGNLLMGGGAGLLSQTRQGSTGAGGAMDIRLAQDLTMSGDARIETLTGTDGHGGALGLRARHASLSSGAYLQTVTLGTGRGGDLDLQLAGDLLVTGGASLYGASFGPGASGNLRAQAAGMQLTQGGYVQVTSTDLGNGGSLSLSSSGDLLLADGGRVLNTVEGAGNGGATLLRAGGLLALSGDSRVTQTTSGAGSTGELRLTAFDLLVDASRVTHNSAFGGGSTGATRLEVTNQLLLDAGQVLATTESGRTGDFLLSGQDIVLRNRSLVLNSAQNPGAQAGQVTLRAADTLQVLNSGVNNLGFGGGQAGDVLLQGAQLTIGEGSRLITSSIDPGSRAGNLTLRGSTSVVVEGGSLVNANTFSDRDAGTVLIEAPSIRVTESGISSSALDGSGNAGGVRLQAGGSLSVSNAQISSSTASQGNGGLIDLAGEDIAIQAGSLVSSGIGVPGTGQGGAVRIAARRDLLIDGRSTVDSSSFSGRGAAGNLALSAGRDLLLRGASVSTLTDGAGNAGALSLLAGRDLRVEGQAAVGSFSTGGGNAGTLSAQAGREMLVTGASRLSTNALGDGQGGSITLRAPVLRVEGDAVVASSTLGGRGDAGAVSLVADTRLQLLRGNVNSLTSGPGNAGSLQLSAPEVRIEDRSQLLASVFPTATGQGGAVRVQAGQQLLVAGQSVIDSSSFGGGPAGRVELVSGGSLAVRGGSLVSSGTNGAQPAGSILVQASAELRFEGKSRVEASTAGSGNAGSLKLQGGDVVLDDSSLNSSTLATGAAGQVDVIASNDLVLRNGALVAAVAGENSGGQTGNVNLVAGNALVLVNSQTTIANGATVRNPAALQPTVLSLKARSIVLRGSEVSATATGNANASRIDIQAEENVDLDQSRVNTSANTGNGGPVRVKGPRLVRLKDSAVTTSVTGNPGGDGGDIAVESELLFLDHGFVQANTAARGARGGNVQINVDAVVATGNRLIVGGDVPLRFIPGDRQPNVIQAAAPDGVGGNVQVAGTIDLAGSLALLERNLLDPGGLGRSPCDRAGGSSLALSGRGGLPGRAPPRPAAPAVQGACR